MNRRGHVREVMINFPWKVKKFSEGKQIRMADFGLAYNDCWQTNLRGNCFTDLSAKLMTDNNFYSKK